MRSGFGRHADDVWGIVFLVLGVLVTLSFFDLAGPVGSGVVSGLELLFGVWAFAVGPALIGLGGALVLSRPRSDYGRMAAGFGVMFVASLALFHLMTGTVSLADSLDVVKERGGAVGSLIAFPLRRVIGFWGAFVVLTAVTSFGVLLLTRTTVREVGHAVVAGSRVAAIAAWETLRGRRRRRRKPVVTVRTGPPARPVPEPVVSAPPPQRPPAKPDTKTKPKPRPKAVDATPDGGYLKPPLELLALGGGVDHSKRILDQTARELEETLLQHGVDARLTRIVPGPTVTRYEIELAPGVKVSKVTGLAHDIAYALATPDVRILAPIPGKSAIGVEVPNRRRQLVTLGDILRSPEAKAAEHPLQVGLGLDISGTPMMLNLSELPHVLIAGATGAGKSSCINAIVTSLLMRTTPEETRLILVDPKRVELGQYNDVPHLLTRVITNPKKAVDALEWAVREMDRRYDLLANAGVRDIIGYQEKFDIGDLDEEVFDRFPYIVVVVDELNDLMMVAGRAVEAAIVRIAQMARAVGIHLVIATQRPSVDVITGVIKANVPSRLAFAVASQADSRVILDTGGAEKLIGLGDMIVVTARDPKPERVQGAWVGEDEIHAVVDWVRDQRKARYESEVFEAAQTQTADDEEFEGEDPEIVRAAIELVVRSQLGSTSMLQRKLRIGFARAGRVMDILERKGIVGPSEGSKARTVLLTEDELDDVLGGVDA
ncbi:MAG TPA: DNA translocase FtsK 4TM domain-containing protein [Acidimicrobiia bacterium]|nr:DNA translocase FtsK 4TM domain-containing protein [Acidimicrobiia bacterium]